MEEPKHEPGCPAIADDESDYEFFRDAGQCCCDFKEYNDQLLERDLISFLNDSCKIANKRMVIHGRTQT